MATTDWELGRFLPQHDLISRPQSTLSDGWDYQRPPPFAPSNPFTAPGDPFASSNQSPSNQTAPLPPSTIRSGPEDWPYPPDPLDGNEAPGPTSPYPTTGSSSSRQTSSQPAVPGPRVSADSEDHWSKYIFDGAYPCHRFESASRLVGGSTCYGAEDPAAFRKLADDGFVDTTMVALDRGSFQVGLYHRPEDRRARLGILQGANGDPTDQRSYCVPLTALKVDRVFSSLQLYRKRRNGDDVLWARLDFIYHERMVLFYCAFLALKYQDLRGVERQLLGDWASLRNGNGAEERLEFAGETLHGNMRHILRILFDTASSVCRLEAAALRGSMKHVPIWTAFITEYVPDRHWARNEGSGIVSLTSLKPYVFVSGYTPPRRSSGQYFLQFSSIQDAKDFMRVLGSIYRKVYLI